MNLHFIREQQNLQFNYFCLMIELSYFLCTGVVDVTLYFHHLCCWNITKKNMNIGVIQKKIEISIIANEIDEMTTTLQILKRGQVMLKVKI